MPVILTGNFSFWRAWKNEMMGWKSQKVDRQHASKAYKVFNINTYLPISIQLTVCCSMVEQNQHNFFVKQATYFNFHKCCHFCTLSPHNLFLLKINMHINRMLKKVQEGSLKAFTIGKTPELPGALPPGPHQEP